MILAATGGGIAVGVVQYQRHEKACAPARADARQQKAALNKLLAAPPTDLPFGSTTEQFQDALANLQARFDHQDEAYRTYYTTITKHSSCFDDDLVAGAKFALRDTEHRDSDTQAYWYCWDAGDPAPHHLGHLVAGDHLCTWGELRSAGVAS
ncbi:hypothetical protein [Streptomyces sp. NPDC007264]|uniref:hypothetical protein n=1 Tax=Streptomyces sp. NPDC007264 TaxID=3364777 RepID=UPI0036DD02B0